jgi:hypothetical protein
VPDNFVHTNNLLSNTTQPPTTLTNTSTKKRSITQENRSKSSKKAKEDVQMLDITEEIQKYFLGQFKLPVTCLVPPSEQRQIRQPDMKFVELLKTEMLSNPTADVAPIIGVLLHENDFDQSHAEAYKYETIGGNHTRIALQQIINENKELPEIYTHRLVSVYRGLSDEHATHLAHRHNRATEFTSKMTTQDKVHICRMRLYSLSGLSLDTTDELPSKSAEWRNSCASTLLMTVSFF